MGAVFRFSLRPTHDEATMVAALGRFHRQPMKRVAFKGTASSRYPTRKTSSPLGSGLRRGIHGPAPARLNLNVGVLRSSFAPGQYTVEARRAMPNGS